MRKFIWSLALLSSAAISWTFINAQEGNQSGVPGPPEEPDSPIQSYEPAQPATQSDSQRTVDFLRYDRTRPRTAAAEPQEQPGRLKNYHQELFGSEAPSAATRAPRPMSRPDLNSIQQVGRSLDVAPTAQPSGVTQAGYTQEPGERSQILQTGASNLAAPLVLPAAGVDADSRPALSAGSSAARVLSQTQGGPALTNFSKETAQVKAEWHALTDINVGQPCKLELHVENNGLAKAANVVVEANFPRSVRLTAATPEPTSATESVSWSFASLDAGQKQIIQITMIPSQRGDAIANANVRFTTAASLVLDVQEPMLQLAVSGPREVTIGESAPHVVTVSNPGSGVAHDVSIEVAIPAGLEHARGQRIKMEIGSLSPGESRTVRLSLVGKSGGKHTLAVVGKSGAELSKSASSEVNVLAPSLEIAVDGPSLRYIGRDARYEIVVKNTGEATNNNVRTMYAVPKSFDFVSATRGGKFDESNGTVTWFVGSIDAGKQVDLSVRLRPTVLGEFAHVARASSEHGAAANAQTMTKIEGAASLVLNVVDLDDPVEIGRETGYEITVRNDGSKEAQNIGLSVELPIGVKLIKASGPSEHIAESGLVVFKSLPTLAPGKTATFQVMITAKEEGNQRLRARLTSSSIQEPLTVEELTRFYAD